LAKRKSEPWSGCGTAAAQQLERRCSGEETENHEQTQQQHVAIVPGN
jgi:hypothetical protein